MHYKITVIGHIGDIDSPHGGQIIKTQLLTFALKERFGDKSIGYVDLHLVKEKPFHFLWLTFKVCRNSENIIILPAHNALLFLPLLCWIFSRRGVKLFYSVIGGWLPLYIKKHPVTEFIIRRFDGIWTETNVMKVKLEKLGFKNVTVVQNFKNNTIVSENEIKNALSFPLKLCIYSRIVKEKGVEDAIRAIKEINERNGKTLLSLDIIGPMQEGYEERFEELKRDFPSYIKYLGSIKSSESKEILKTYFALLFPTRYTTEGIPGTIIDGYFAGLPVISARWISYVDVVEEGKTGVGFEQCNYDDLLRVLQEIIDNPITINEMRKNCLKKAEEYTQDSAIKKIVSLMGIE